MATKQRKHKHPNDLPGTIYRNKKRYWWKVQLPGESKPKAHPLKPIGSRYATTDYAVAVECARQLLQQHLFKKNVPFQGEVKTVADLVRAYMAFAEEYYVTPAGKATIEVQNIKYTLNVLLECFPSLPCEEFGPLRLKEVREAMINKKWCRTGLCLSLFSSSRLG